MRPLTRVSGRTDALVVVDAVHAGAVVLARAVGAVVHVLVAQLAHEAVRAAAGVAVHLVEALLAGRALDAAALVDVVLTLETLETCGRGRPSGGGGGLGQGKGLAGELMGFSDGSYAAEAHI